MTRRFSFLVISFHLLLSTGFPLPIQAAENLDLWGPGFYQGNDPIELEFQLEALNSTEPIVPLPELSVAQTREIRDEFRVRRIAELARSTRMYSQCVDPLLVFVQSPGHAPIVQAAADSLLARSLWSSGRWRDAHTYWDRSGWLLPHWIIGPFENERGSGFNVGTDVESQPSLNESHEGTRSSVSWRKTRPSSTPSESHGRTDGLDLTQLLTPSEDVLCYMQTFVHAPENGPATLRVSSSGSYAVWWNGTEVARRDVERPIGFDQDSILIPLRAGWNRVLIKSATTSGPWGWKGRLTDLRGKPLLLTTTDMPPPNEPIASAGTVDPEWISDEGAKTRLADRADGQSLFLRGWLLSNRAAHDRSEHPDRDLFHASHAASPSVLALYHFSRTFLGRVTHEAQREENRWRQSLEATLAIDPSFARAELDLAEYYWTRFSNGTKTREHLERYQAALGNGKTPESTRSLELRRRWKVSRLGPPAGLPILARIESRLDQEALLSLRVELARRDLSRGFPKKALARLDGGLKYDVLDWGIQSTRVAILRATGDLVAARTEQLQFADRVATDPALYFDLAEAESNDERWDEALAANNRALSLQPDSERLLEQRGEILIASGQVPEGLAVFRRSLELDPNQPRLREYTELLAEASASWSTPYRVDVSGLFDKARSEATTENDSYRILLDNSAVSIQEEGTTRRYRQLLIQVLNDAGVRGLDAYPIRYAYGEQWVRVRKATVTHPDATQEEARIRNRPPDKRSGEYPTWSTAWIDLPPLRVGSVVEIEYLQEDLKQSFFGDYFGDTVLFGDRAPVWRKIYTLEAPENKPLFFHARSLDVDPTVALENGRKRWSWDVRDLQKIDPEEAMPPVTEIGASLQISTFKDWDEFSTWYHHLIRKQFESSDAIRLKVSELTTGLTTREEKVRAIYEFVVSEVRYIAWEFGVHGFKPYKASTIFDRRFGDCKDKATLICTMLGELDIQAYPVLIEGTQNREREDFTLPLVSHFNHCIAYVPRDDDATRSGRFIDGTAEHHPYGTLPTMDYGAKVLIVRPDGSELADIPWNTPDERMIDETVTVTLRADGGASISQLNRLTGGFAVAARSGFEIIGERTRQLEAILGQRFPGVTVKNVETSPLDDLSEQVWIRTEYEVPRYLEPTSDGFKLPPPTDLFGSTQSINRWIARETRQWDLSLGTPMRSMLRIELDLPAELQLSSDPDQIEGSTPFGQFKFSAALEGRKLVLERDLVLSAPRVPAAGYASFRALLESVQESRNRTIRLKKSKEAQ